MLKHIKTLLKERNSSQFPHNNLFQHQTMTPFSSVQSPSHVQLFETPWTAASQASLSLTISRSLPKCMSIESVMPSNHLILCNPLLLLPSIFPSIEVSHHNWDTNLFFKKRRTGFLLVKRNAINNLKGKSKSIIKINRPAFHILI